MWPGIFCDAVARSSTLLAVLGPVLCRSVGEIYGDVPDANYVPIRSLGLSCRTSKVSLNLSGVDRVLIEAAAPTEPSVPTSVG